MLDAFDFHDVAPSNRPVHREGLGFDDGSEPQLGGNVLEPLLEEDAEPAAAGVKADQRYALAG